MKIAFDLDGTLLNLRPIFENALKKHDFGYYPPVTYDFINYPPKAKEEIIGRFKHDHYSIYSLPFFEGVYETIMNLRNKHDVYIITARYNEDKTKQFVNVLLNIPVDKIFVTNSKLPILRKLGIDLWIDDNPEDLIKFHNQGIKCIMVNHIYNSHLKGIMPNVDNVSHIKF